uniref:t-SNARE coiled-coil homology domain-containing protein n=1 Tax=Culex tarsalis TaxID=7177 RepID=A0A1Q3G512_CULTA
MAEGTYEYECMRAELLGVEKPNREEFEEKMRLRREAEQEELLADNLTEVNLHDEQIGGTSGKMDELNSILSITQQRINKFKVACGSLTTLLKFRPSTPSEGASTSNPDNEAASCSINDSLDTLDAMKELQNASDVSVAKSAATDLGQKMTSQLGKLDSLINKADNAAYSMKHQTDQMKKISK